MLVFDRTREPVAQLPTMATIRDYLDHFLGRRVVDITEGIDDPGGPWIWLQFDDGSYIRIPVGELGLPWGTTNQCLDHSGCIAGEFTPSSPEVLIR